jgi:hypothetical protein
MTVKKPGSSVAKSLAMDWMIRVRFSAWTGIIPSPPFSYQKWLFPLGQRGWKMKLSTDLHLVLKLRCVELYLHSPIYFHAVVLEHS